MENIKIIEIAERVRRTSHRVKNAGRLNLYRKGLLIARQIECAKDFIEAIKFENQYFSILKEIYSIVFPLGTPSPKLTMNGSGYEETSTQPSDGNFNIDTGSEPRTTNVPYQPSPSGSGSGDDTGSSNSGATGGSGSNSDSDSSSNQQWQPNFTSPVSSGTITTQHGVIDAAHPIETHPNGHVGIDMVNNSTDTTVRAAADGTIVVAGPVTGYGNAVYLDHQNPNNPNEHYVTRYGHININPTAQVNQQVHQGDPIGNIAPGVIGNSTGSHLHFEIRHVDTNDPSQTIFNNHSPAVNPTDVTHNLPGN